MKLILKFAVYIFLIGIIVFASCRKRDQLDKPPVAIAGADQSINHPLDSVELQGSGTDADGTIMNYNWTKVSGPSQFTIVNPNAAITKVKNLVQGVYEFELKVTDNGWFSARDTVVITVDAKIIKVRVIEYGTNLTIEWVNVQLRTLTEPPYQTESFITDNNGEFLFHADQFQYQSASKDGYWEYGGRVNKYFAYDSIYDIDYVIKTDSLIVSMFPKTFITIHVKNSIAILNNNCDLMRLGVLYKKPSWLSAAWIFFPQDLISLRPAIDTTFQYPVFGNADNMFYVGDPGRSDEWYPYANVYYLYAKSEYIIKGSNITLNITY